jgi:hypothetical protein
MQRIIKDFEYIYFFKEAFDSKLIGRPYFLNENESKKLKSSLKRMEQSSILLMMTTLIKQRVIIME